MPPSRSRYITVCQQLLALGVVVVALAPATRVVSLDVVDVHPGTNTGQPTVGTPEVALSAYVREVGRTSRVPTAPVEPVVREVPLTTGSGAARTSGVAAGQARTSTTETGRTRITGTAEGLSGFGTVGVTWQRGQRLAERDIDLELRTESRGAWTRWQPMDYDEEHGPDPESAEASSARPGTDEALVGTVDRVQVRVTLDGDTAPADLRLAVVEAGVAARTRAERPAIDTAAADDSATVSRGASTRATSGSARTLAAYTPKPQIYSRAQWGADETMRDATSLHYGRVSGGFVHHTVNSNDYKRRDVPAIIRSIYAYHTRSRGWSDIGYNLLVDRFGRIWEGRYGGVDRPVVGAHTLDYNDASFAMSAIGNFELVKPSPAVLQAYGAVFAWKLSLHGVSAASTFQQIGATAFPAINGHRDAASTACPGGYLYKKLPKIRKLAAAAQRGWTGRDLRSDLVGSKGPDLVLRRAKDGKAVILPLRADGRPGKKVKTGMDLRDADLLLKVGDWDRDGRGDLVTRSVSTGALELRRGVGKGKFAAPLAIGAGFGTVTLIAAVGDMTGDGYPDIVGQPAGGALTLWPGAGGAGLGTAYAVEGALSATAVYGGGLWDGDGAPDTLARAGTQLVLYPGNGPGAFSGPTTLPLDLGDVSALVPLADASGDGHPDVVARTVSTGDLYLFPATASGFAAPQFLAKGAKYDLTG